MKSICFHCQFVGVGVVDPRCPQCSYPLIMNMGGAALATKDLEKLFAHAAPAHKAPPLPGVSAEPRQAQLLMEKRRQRAQAMVEAKRAQEELLKQQTRRRALAKSFAASAAVALGLLLTLNVFGAL